MTQYLELLISGDDSNLTCITSASQFTVLCLITSHNWHPLPCTSSISFRL